MMINGPGHPSGAVWHRERGRVMKESRVVAQVVPELSVRDLAASLRFYVDLLGWTLAYERPDDGFACLRLERIDPLLDRSDLGRNFDESIAVSDHPVGLGLNPEMTLAANGPIRARQRRAEWPLALQPENMWDRCGTRQVGQRQFVIADPDSHLLRVCERLRDRADPDGAADAL